MAEQRILVTGSNGTLGQDCLARFSLFPDWTVIGTNSLELNLAWDEYTIFEALNEIRPDIIVNTAAYTQVDKAESDFETACLVNANGPKHLAKWAQRHHAYLLHISTDYVFDGEKGGLYVPDDFTNPINRYGESKRMGEDAVLEIHPSASGIIRTSWLFGAGAKNFVPFVIRSLQSNTIANIVDDQWGTPTWTGNLCKMLIEAIQSRVTGIYHGCSTGQCNRYEQALFIAEQLQADKKLVIPQPSAFFDFPARRPHNTAMQSSFASALPWQGSTLKFLETQGYLAKNA